MTKSRGQKKIPIITAYGSTLGVKKARVALHGNAVNTAKMWDATDQDDSFSSVLYVLLPIFLIYGRTSMSLDNVY